MSPKCEKAYEDVLSVGKALLKFITPNEVDSRQSHQAGYYLPKTAAYLFTPQAVEKGINHDHSVEITWHDGSITHSTVKWYGTGSRSEYRITGWGKAFPWANNTDLIGDLLVLIPTKTQEINGYILDLEEDIDEILDNLGLVLVRTRPSGAFAVYDVERPHVLVETEDKCLVRKFDNFVLKIEEMPDGRAFTAATIDAIKECVHGFSSLKEDEKLLRALHEEYNLFKQAERKIYSTSITSVFRSVDDFVETALRILNARKSRAGRSFENHVEFLLNDSHIPHEMRSKIHGRPDVIIPNSNAYEDSSFPDEKIFVVALKTTCKDRWRQVLQEAPRIKKKHLMTLQEGISTPQLDEMAEAGITLVVPSELHKAYPKERKHLLHSVGQFIAEVRTVYY